ncbi:hypothetical protein F-M6_0498 [Faustovirus]|nr:hypothetical protein F-M6_0498 [Faustovirus]
MDTQRLPDEILCAIAVYDWRTWRALVAANRALYALLCRTERVKLFHAWLDLDDQPGFNPSALQSMYYIYFKHLRCRSYEAMHVYKWGNIHKEYHYVDCGDYVEIKLIIRTITRGGKEYKERYDRVGHEISKTLTIGTELVQSEYWRIGSRLHYILAKVGIRYDAYKVREPKVGPRWVIKHPKFVFNVADHITNGTKA